MHQGAMFGLQPGEIVVDNFAGGGGASLGIEIALGRSPDIACNHDAQAVAMHAINHPETLHLCQNVWEVDPVAVCAGRPVGLAWFSPDCKHFSRAKGGKPNAKKIRGLAWTVTRWAKAVRPRVIVLENVEEFQTWGPLLGDGTPCPARKGKTFRAWLSRLRRCGYDVETRVLRACDYGAPTTRTRLFLIARCDGQPIVWPTPTHGPGTARPYRTAAECMDWSIPCPSIFERARPLAENTLRRIARGIQRYVIDAAEPFIVGAGVPSLIQTGYGERKGQAPRVLDLHKPLGTVVAGGIKHALVTAFLAKHYGGHEGPGSSLARAFDTVTAVDHHALVATNLVKLYGTSTGAAMRAPVPTVTATGQHLGEVRAFLVKYYSTGQAPDLREPLHTVTTRDRFGVVTVAGERYQIADIGMRMLAPRELFRAQGFPDSYRIDDFDVDGKPLTKSAQVRMCGNSVCPPIAAAIVTANMTASWAMQGVA